jgi:hypothetical protein
MSTPLTVLPFLPTGFPDNNAVRVGEDNYDSLSADPSYVADPYGPRPETQPPVQT